MTVYLDSQATFLRTTFSNNKAGANGGAVVFQINRPHAVDGPSLVKDCVFKHNNASGTGGAMDVNSLFTTLLVHTTLIHFNYAGDSGGGLSGSNDAIVTVEDSVIANNAARNKATDVVRLLIETGVKLNVVNEGWNHSPLDQCAWHGNRAEAS